MDEKKVHRALAAVSLLLSASCSSGIPIIAPQRTATVSFVCDGPTNGGLLLTVDVVQASEEQKNRIRELGEKWFYDPMRDGLRDRMQTVTFPTPPDKPRCEKVIEVPVAKKKDEKFIVVIADYKFQNPDPSRYIAVLSRDKIKKNVVIALRDQELQVREQ